MLTHSCPTRRSSGRMNSRRELRWQIVVEEEPQAALFGPGCSSNLTAARTADGFTANQRATRSTEPSATTASARIVVGTPSPFVIGCPNARNGSITMCDLFPMGHQRTGASFGENSMPLRSEEHTSELQSLMRISYAVFCLKKTKTKRIKKYTISHNTNTN